MSETDGDQGTVKVKTSHLWNGLWTAVILTVGVGITGIIDDRITNHPKVIETYNMVRDERVKTEQISKTVVKLEVLLERNEKMMEELLAAARGN